MPSIKLSVTVRSALVAKYSPAALARIDAAVAAWIKADLARGIRTLHVALDDPAGMTAQGVAPVKGKVSAQKAKRAIDALAKKLAPEYIVILGGDDVIPYFRVKNPSHDPDGDTDVMVATDNPYASSRVYRASAIKSYLIPDRVVGRIPDLPGAAGADPLWLVTPLKTATAWTPKPAVFYGSAYATCCDAWKNAGLATMRYLGLPTADLMISPPTVDATATARGRLARTLHFTKCHGAQIDANFYGQKGNSFPEILFSGTLAGQIVPGTLPAAMCCYGAQVYSPADPAARPAGALPISMTYLRGGAVGFMGSTEIAWVGPQIMMCADWIVAAYLKKALAGASLGRAMMESKQDYVQYVTGQGQRLDTADEKTMIEFVLLGDPSLHPVAAPAPAVRSRSAASSVEVVQRGERRIARAALAAQVTRELPERVSARAPAAATARKIFAAVAGMLDKSDQNFLEPGRARASKLVSAPVAARAVATRGLASAVGATRQLAESVEYTWTGRKIVDGRPHVRLLTVEADAGGNVLRSRLLHSA